jgi:uncharacterized protein (DUF362 family)/NAD-dependent dihydropyrimidine dehydrogenase PreA subunit
VKDDTVHPSTVALVRCEDYDESRVFDAVSRGLSLLGGLERFARPAEKVLLKPNLLAGTAPDKAVTTHPSVFRAVAKHFLDLGPHVSYGDSPGFGRPESVARRAGLVKVAEDLGLPLADFVNGSTVSFPEGHLIHQFTVAQGVLDSDAVISLPKLKTHALVRMTGAVKNQFGCTPGFLKGEFHARMVEMDRFARMLVDLTRFVRPRLYIMDAVVAMEGNGPRGGNPRSMGVLLLSTDPVALDAVASRMIDLEPALVPTTRWGQDIGLGTYTQVNVIGDALDPFIRRDFKVERRKDRTKTALPRFVARFAKNLLVPRPVIDPSLCTRCGTCVKVCPATPKAVDFRTGDRKSPPTYNYKICIRCYCCQELCPERAISVEIPPVGRLIHRS